MTQRPTEVDLMPLQVEQAGLRIGRFWRGAVNRIEESLSKGEAVALPAACLYKVPAFYEQFDGGLGSGERDVECPARDVAEMCGVLNSRSAEGIAVVLTRSSSN